MLEQYFAMHKLTTRLNKNFQGQPIGGYVVFLLESSSIIQRISFLEDSLFKTAIYNAASPAIEVKEKKFQEFLINNLDK